MITLTYWEWPALRRSADDYDEIRTVRVKHVDEIPQLIADRPPKTRMISTEHSAPRRLKNGQHTNFFKIVWEDGKLYYTPRSQPNKSITIVYPPTFDGELWIDVLESEKYYEYEFRYTKTPEPAHTLNTPWEVLVRAAKDILAQDVRMRSK